MFFLIRFSFLLVLIGTDITQILYGQSVQEDTTTLQHQLNHLKTDFVKRASADRVALYEQGIADVEHSGVLERALKVGNKAPNFSLPNARGSKTALTDLLKDGSVIVIFYRGGWCPYCNIQLKMLQKYVPAFCKLNATLVAISPEIPDSSLKTSEKNKLQFEVLSDTSNITARQYGVVYSIPERLQSNFEPVLQRYNGAGNAKELPIAATYIIEPDGYIRYAFLDSDYRKRAEPLEIIAYLQKRAGQKTR